MWLDNDKFIVSTKSSTIILFDQFEVKQDIEHAFQQDGSFVTAISKFSKGFIISSDKGDMAMWVRSEDNNSTSGKQAYDFIRKW